MPKKSKPLSLPEKLYLMAISNGSDLDPVAFKKNGARLLKEKYVEVIQNCDGFDIKLTEKGRDVIGYETLPLEPFPKRAFSPATFPAIAKKIKVAEAARDYMIENDIELIYAGTFGALHDIADRAGKFQKSHPLNVIAGVMSCIGKSPLFKKAGQIEHLGRYHPVYKLAATP